MHSRINSGRPPANKTSNIARGRRHPAAYSNWNKAGHYPPAYGNEKWFIPEATQERIHTISASNNRRGRWPLNRYKPGLGVAHEPIAQLKTNKRRNNYLRHKTPTCTHMPVAEQKWRIPRRCKTKRASMPHIMVGQWWGAQETN